MILRFFDNVADDAPYCELGVGVYFDCRIFGICGHKQDAPGFEAHALERKLPIDEGHGQASAVWLHGLIDHQQVALGDALVLHGVPSTRA